MKNEKLKFKIQNFLVIFLLLFFARPVFASQMFFETKTTKIGIKGETEVDLFINSEKESLNAYEAKISFSNDILNVKEIKDGNSIVTFWIEKPKIENGQISFSGITPGGFNGEKGLILSIIFEAKKEGISKLEIKNARVLKNDAMGSEAYLSILPFEILVFKEIPPQEVLKIEDKEPPELFSPEIAQNPNLFNGQWFLVFLTQDKGSGISHYEILEKEQKNSVRSLFKKNKWQIGESPYLLKDQKLKSQIYVKAVDKAGNERIVFIPPKNPLSWYENYKNWIIIILGLFFILFILKAIKSKIKSQNEK